MAAKAGNFTELRDNAPRQTARRCVRGSGLHQRRAMPLQRRRSDDRSPHSSAVLRQQPRSDPALSAPARLHQKYAQRLALLPPPGPRAPKRMGVSVCSSGAGLHRVQRRARGHSYAIDSYPVLVCANCRIRRCRLFPVQEHAALRGYQTSKKRYFYGFKVHLLVTSAGEPVEFFLSQGSLHDIEGLRALPLDLSRGSSLWGDKAYQDQSEQAFCKRRRALQVWLSKQKCTRAAAPMPGLPHPNRQAAGRNRLFSGRSYAAKTSARRFTSRFSAQATNRRHRLCFR